MSEAAAERKASVPLIVGRYALFDELAAGGMATVHLARLLTNDGPGRTVAIKRLHAQYAKDNEFCTMFMDEARLVTRIKHPNCVRTVDVVQADEGLFLVMEYVHGESLSRLMRTTRERKEAIPAKLVATVVHNALLGLHAAHEVTGDDGKPLNVVHRDVSPQNIIVGVDGAAKVLDFGIAKAAGRMQTTREGQIKGKLAYMAPEQIRGQVDRRTDVFAAAVCLWEALAARRLHEGLKDVEIVTRVVQGKFVPPSTYASGISRDLDEIVLKGLAADPKKRYLTAKDMAADIESKVGLMDRSEIGRWVDRLAKPLLDKRAAKVAAMERAAKDLRPSSRSIRMPALSTPDAFAPVSAIEPAPAKSEQDVRAELDAVAPTTPPPYTPAPEVVAAAAVPHEKPPVPRSPTATGPQPRQTAAGAGLRTGTPVLPMSPVRVPVAPVGAPLPPAPAIVPAGANDTGNTQHTQLTPSGIETPLTSESPPVEVAPRRSLVIAVVAASVLLALAGAALGGYALAKRQVAPTPTPQASPDVKPTVTTPPVPSPSVLPPAPPVSATAPQEEPNAVTDLDDVAPTASASASASASATPSASAAPAPTAKPKPKANECDPPYVIENGVQKYKPECMF